MSGGPKLVVASADSRQTQGRCRQCLQSPDLITLYLGGLEWSINNIWVRCRRFTRCFSPGFVALCVNQIQSPSVSFSLNWRIFSFMSFVSFLSFLFLVILCCFFFLSFFLTNLVAYDWSDNGKDDSENRKGDFCTSQETENKKIKSKEAKQTKC